MDNAPSLGYGDSEPATVKGAATTRRDKRNDDRPTHDQLYLAGFFSVDAAQPRLGPAPLQRLNRRYGVGIVTEALRLMHGFPPEIAVRSQYAYLEGICRGQS